jgi:hypothetical protein
MNELITKFIEQNKDAFEAISDANNDLAQALMNVLVSVDNLITDEAVKFDDNEVDNLLNPKEISLDELKPAVEQVNDIINKISETVEKKDITPETTGEPTAAAELLAKSIFNCIQQDEVSVWGLPYLIFKTKDNEIGFLEFAEKGKTRTSINNYEGKRVKGKSFFKVYSKSEFLGDLPAKKQPEYPLNNILLKADGNFLLESAAKDSSKFKNWADVDKFLIDEDVYENLPAATLNFIYEISKLIPTSYAVSTTYQNIRIVFVATQDGIFYDFYDSVGTKICRAMGRWGYLNVMLMLFDLSIEINALLENPYQQKLTNITVTQPTPVVSSRNDFQDKINELKNSLTADVKEFGERLDMAVNQLKLNKPIRLSEIESFVIAKYLPIEIANSPDEITPETKILNFNFNARQNFNQQAVNKVYGAINSGQIEIILKEFIASDYRASVFGSQVELTNVYFANRIIDDCPITDKTIIDLGNLRIVTDQIYTPNLDISNNLLQTSSSKQNLINFPPFANYWYITNQNFDNFNDEQKQRLLFKNLQISSGRIYGGTPSVYDVQLKALSYAMPLINQPQLTVSQELQLLNVFNRLLSYRYVDVENKIFAPFSDQESTNLLKQFFSEPFVSKFSATTQATPTSKPTKAKANRPSPSESATSFPDGTIKVGNDGNEWIVKTNKNGVNQWKPWKGVIPTPKPTPDDDFGIDVNDPELQKLQKINDDLIESLKNINTDDIDI